MNCYTAAAVAALFGVEEGRLAAVLKPAEARKGYPTFHQIKKPLDVGERKPARYVAATKVDGEIRYALFPTLQSMKLWHGADRAYWAATLVG